jgi:hypothetical protein
MNRPSLILAVAVLFGLVSLAVVLISGVHSGEVTVWAP